MFYTFIVDAKMSAHIDNAELMSLLESSDIHTINEVKNLIRDQLSTGS